MNDKNKAIIIGILLLLLMLLAFSTRNLIYNSILELQHSGQYAHESLQTVNILSIFFLIIFSFVFSVLGFRKAKEKGFNAQLWAVISFFFNLWGYLFLLLKKAR